jgi:hypothetical protein
VNVRRNLLAKVHRNVYYQWAELAKTAPVENKDEHNPKYTELFFMSANKKFTLGFY